ncbi:MAG: Ohr family peroxiredoxin [Aestuariivirga sp.]
MAIKKLYTAVVTATGGRGNGTAKSDDGFVDLKIGQPKKLGGDDAGLNPEQLFGAGYSNCYLGAIKYVAGKEKKPVAISPDSSVTAHVSFGPRADKKGFGIEVKLDVKLPGVKKAAATALAKKAHVVCPYSHAVRKNVKVTTRIV